MHYIKALGLKKLQESEDCEKTNFPARFEAENGNPRLSGSLSKRGTLWSCQKDTEAAPVQAGHETEELFLSTSPDNLVINK